MTTIIGIVNLTTDSFSDGGHYLDPQRALQHARELLGQGAHYVDLGPASSNPDAAPVSATEQIARLAPVVAALEHSRISVDATEPQVIRWALGQQLAMLNDIRGFGEPALWPELARAHCQLVVMHSLAGALVADRRDVEPEQVWQSVIDFFDRRIAALTGAGIARERLILDPGMGFFLGANPQASVLLLRRLPQLRERYGLPLYVSVSRKSFLGALVGGRPVAERAAATLAAELFAFANGADYIRTHDVQALADGLRVQNALG